MRDRSRRMAEVRSALTGRVVDSYTNILTVKLFARARDEDEFVREAVDDHTTAFHAQLRMITRFSGTLFGDERLHGDRHRRDGGVAVEHRAYRGRHGGHGAAAGAWQIANVAAGWRRTSPLSSRMSAWCRTACAPSPCRARCRTRRMPGELVVTRGALRFEHVRFGYGRAAPVAHGPARRAARPRPAIRAWRARRAGRASRAPGKSTLVNLLLGFYAPEARAHPDRRAGHRRRHARRACAGRSRMVTQDTSLLHRSIRDNIRYGRPDATRGGDGGRRAAGRGAEFIATLEDWDGRQRLSTRMSASAA